MLSNLQPKKTIVFVLLLAVLTLAAYAPALFSTFKTIDDEYSIVQNEMLRSFANVPEIFTTSFFRMNAYYRPLVTFSFMIEYRLFGLRPFFYYLTNILLHIAAALCLWRILLKILQNENLAKAAALLFALHPVQWEAVALIPGRSILLAALFSLTAFLCFLKKEEARTFKWFSLICFILGILSKESAVMLPFILIAYQYLIARPRETRWQEKLRPVMPFLTALVVYLVVRKMLGITRLNAWGDPYYAFLGFVTFLRSLLTAFRLFLFPLGLHFDRSRAIFQSLLAPGAIAAIIIFTVLIGIFLKYRREIPLTVKFFTAWIFIELFPVSQIVSSVGVHRGYISTADHFLYLPSAGFFVLLILALEALKQNPRLKDVLSPEIKRVVIAGYGLFLFIMTLSYALFSCNQVAMMEKSLRINPHNERVRSSLALAYAKDNQFEKAEESFRRVLAADPGDAKARIGLGKALCDQEKYWDGLAEYEKVGNPGHMKKLLNENIRLTCELLIKKYRAMPAAGPKRADLEYTLGVLYTKTGKIDQAIEYYETSIRLRPRFANALFNLASIYETMGEDRKAVEYYEKFLKADEPEPALVRFAYGRLGKIYQKLGDNR